MISALCAMPRMRARAILSALPAVLKKQVDEDIFAVYVTDALKVVAENTAHFAGGNSMTDRYINLVHPKKEETRTEREIIDHVIKRGWGGDRA